MSAFGSRPEFKLPFLILVALALIQIPGVVVASTEAVVFEGSFSPELWSWEKSPDGDVLPVLEGTRKLAEPGLPAVPVQDLILLIPAGRTVLDAWVEPLTTRIEKFSGLPTLASPHMTDGGEMVSTSRMNSVNGVFPAVWGEFSGTHTWRGYNLLTLNVYPARIEDQQITYLDDYAIRVIYENGQQDRVSLERERFVSGEKTANENTLREILSNPMAVAGYSRAGGIMVAEDKGVFNPTKTPSLSGSAVTYLIITNEAMKDEFQRMADYKTSIGIPSLVVTREYIEGNFRHGADIQETIRMFIQDSYSKWGTEYVLLAGDTDILPARYVDNSFYPPQGATEIPVDLYFACLDGTWNANNNAHFGEADDVALGNDDVDFAEEVYLGRATVSDATAAQVFVDKVITYETTPHGSEWTNRILYACEVLFFDDYGEIVLDGAQFSDQMVNELVEPCTEMEYVRMYETDELFPMDANLSKAALIDSLNTGHYGIFNQIGHGFYFNMSVGNGNFMTTDADNLTNGDHLFALFSLNCASAAFDYSCLMERFLQNPNGGSILSIGSARAAFPNNSNNYQQGFFDALMCTEDNRAGKLVALSRLPYLGSTSYNYVDRWTFQNYTLLGDPTLTIWTGSPRQLNVASSDLDLGPNNLTVVVNDGGLPLENAQVTLSRNGDNYSTGMTNISGAVSLEYLANAPGEVDLRITGVNAAQNISVVDVLNGTTYLAMENLVAQDDGTNSTVGNGNFEIESGETVNLFPLLVETAGSGTTGLTGVLSTNDPLVNITIATVAFSAVSGNGSTSPTVPFEIVFDSGIVDGTPVVFDLVLTDATMSTYEIQWTTIVKAPELEVVMLDWDDSSYGNGDGLLGIDERLTVTLKFKNFGAGRADIVDVRLRPKGVGTVVFDSVGTVFDLELMESSGVLNGFSLSIGDLTMKAQAYVDLIDNYGRLTRHEFLLHRPAVPVIYDTDTSLGADVIALSWEPVSEDRLCGYNIYRSLSNSGPFEQVNEDPVFGTSYYRDEGLQLLTKYYYRVVSMYESLIPSLASDIVEQATAPAEQTGFPVEFEVETSGHLAVGDIDGDGYSEIILGSDELYVWHHDGTELLDGDNDSQTLGPLTALETTFNPAGIVLAQLDGQRGMEMIVCDSTSPELIYIFDKNGDVLPGWPQSTHSGVGTQWVWATPAVGDIDGDGDQEIVVNALNGHTWAWHHDGTEVLDGDNDPATNGLFLFRSGAVWEWGLSSPTLYDLDGDGAKDIIFGTGYDDLGAHKILALKSDGSYVPGFPYFTYGRVNNSPAVGDLNNDGVVEIVFYDKSGYIFAVQQDGTTYPGFPTAFGIGTMSGGLPSVALGDMDEDGELEIIFAGNVNGDLSKLIIVDTDISGGTSGEALAGWPQSLPGSSEGSPVVGDIDGDGIPDILFGIGGGSEDAPNNLYAFKTNGSTIDGFPITLNGPLMPSPVICDLDRDLDVDIVYGGWDREVHVWDMPFAYDARNCPWPTFHGNMQRDGVIIRDYMVDVEETNDLPAAAFKVDSPYPNPFNPSTTIRLHVPVVNGSSSLELVVYDLQGRKVRVLHNGAISSGWHTMVWDGNDGTGRNQSSGLYFMRARSGQHSSIHKITLVK